MTSRTTAIAAALSLLPLGQPLLQGNALSAAKGVLLQPSAAIAQYVTNNASLQLRLLT